MTHRLPSRHTTTARSTCDPSGRAEVVQDVEDDARLVGAAADGDEIAFRTLVERHYDPCLRYATRMLGDRFDAEDAVQEAFVRAYRGLARYEDQGRFKAWLFRILVNRCRTAARIETRRRSRQVRPDAVPEQELAVRQPASTPFRSAAVKRAMATLPEKLKEAFLLKFVEGWTYEEMTELTGASVPALKMRVARARDSLRETLGEVGHD